MYLILLLALIFLCVTSLILLRNIVDFESLKKKSNVNSSDIRVSLCIPARNEESVIKNCVEAACRQKYDNFEVVVLDDQSDDNTPHILNELSGQLPERLKIIKGSPKPEGWLGKPFACHQLSEKASGDILIFIDADVTLSDTAVSKAVAVITNEQIGFLTVWPRQILNSFFEKLIIPLIYHGLLTLLPVVYTERKPFWLPEFLHRKHPDMFAAACGQFMAFRKDNYQKFGGHASVKDKVVEDVELAKIVRKHGTPMKMMYGASVVNCRMYTSHSEIWNGLRKNFFAGFNYNYLLFIFMSFIHLVVYILPVITLILSIYNVLTPLTGFISAAIVMLMVIQRIVLAIWMKWNILFSFSHPTGVIWFQLLALQCLADRVFKRKVSWKNRSTSI